MLHPIPQLRAGPTSRFRPATLPPALVAGADLPSSACRSLPDCHQVGLWEPHELRVPAPPCPVLTRGLAAQACRPVQPSWAFCSGIGLARQGGVTSTAPPTSALSSSTALWPGHRLTPHAWPPSTASQTRPRCPPPAQGLRCLGRGLRLLCGGRRGRRCGDRRQGCSLGGP